jgi:hypothetical protein
LLQVYEQYQGNDLIAKNALNAIRNLAANSENKARIVNAGKGHLLPALCVIC